MMRVFPSAQALARASVLGAAVSLGAACHGEENWMRTCVSYVCIKRSAHSSQTSER